MKPRISVVIPCYNGEKYISEAINSLLNQTRPADEIIVSDDNSTDNTVELCKSFGDKIILFQNPDGPSGFVNGWNNAIKHATGDYISILHQDDLLDPTFLEEIEKAIIEYPNVKHLFAPCRYIDQNGKIIRERVDYCNGELHYFTGQEYANAYERVKNHIHRCPGVVTHKDIFKICTYRECAGHIADDDFFLRVGNFTDIVGILKPLASYREHVGSETGHLSFLTINARLLHDYHFQLEHAEENPLLSDEIIETFSRWEAEYIHRLIIFGIKGIKLGYVGKALKKWFCFKKGKKFGNIVYDLSKLKSILKRKLKNARIKSLQHRVASLEEINVSSIQSPVIVAPHPDDEVIGCGGLIARLVAEGHAPHIIIMTGGEASHRGCCETPADTIIRARRGLTRRALSILGVPGENIHELNFPDGGISVDCKEMAKLRDLLGGLMPDRVFVPHWGEGWSDHVKTAEVVKSICQPQTEVWEYCVWMWYYNVWRGLNWENAAVLRMTPAEHELKLRAIDAYTLPLAPCGNPWSGVLPKVFLDANKWNKELYFRI